MTKALIIAEKPSVANDIAKSLGGFTKEGDYYESEKYVLTSAVGHLLEIGAPEKYEVKRGKWSFANLPVIPPYFAMTPIAKTETRLKLLNRLIRRKDVSEIINACDAGREGELIFRLIAEYTKAKQPVKRLWLQSMTPGAIRDGFNNLRDDKDMLPLAAAAKSRSEADWLIGINGTRAMTAFNSKDGGFFLTTVGRVQTPTLSIVVNREKKIRDFISKDYWEVHADFVCEKGVYEGRWQDMHFKKDPSDPEKRAERIWNRADAEAVAAACRGKKGTVTEESKPSTSLSPALFDLTTLQREANVRFGFSAKNTLALAQALYERHKVLTYPRTDSQHLPEDYINTCRQIMENMAEGSLYKDFAEKILQNKWIRPNRRIFDNRKISDHFAIIPTTLQPKKLSEPEQKLYDLVTRRFLAVFFPAAEFLVTTRFTEIEGHSFRSSGRVMTNPGWLSVYGREMPATGRPGEHDQFLVPVSPNEKVLAEKVSLDELATKPPARYTEATLLSAMEGAGKLLDEDELKEAMKGKGLGTPATRSSIIEGLLGEKYLLREGRELIPTPKAFQLMTLLKGLGISELTLPELTGEWEYKLAQMEKGEISREEFMEQIARMTQTIVDCAKKYDGETVPGEYITLNARCPACGGEVSENYRRFACAACSFSMTKTPGGRLLSAAEAEELLTNGKIGPLQGFRSKMGRPFAAILKIVKDEDGSCRMEFDFGQQPADDAAKPVEITGPSLGTCPKCGGSVGDSGLAYICEHAAERPKSCDFRISRVILQKNIEPSEVEKLLKEGQTSLLTGFVSNRTNRPFKAYLVMGKDGKLSFKFDTPAPKVSAKSAEAAGTKASSGTTAKTASKSSAASSRRKTATASGKAPAEEAEKPRRTPAKRTAAKKS